MVNFQLCGFSLQLRSIQNSLAVQWLGLHDFTAEAPGSVPGWETKIPQAMWHGQNKNKQIHKTLNEQVKKQIIEKGINKLEDTTAEIIQNARQRNRCQET